MPNELIDTAQKIASELKRLDDERHRIGRDGFSVLERLDSEFATVAKSVWDGDSAAASEWFTSRIESLEWKTPWQRIADNERDKVKDVLLAMEYGIYT